MVEEYLIQLGIKRKLNEDQIFEMMEKMNGESFCRELENLMVKRYQKKSINSDFYKFINRSYNSSVSFFGGYDGDYFYEVLSRIEKNKSLLGKRILDIGCNNGIISCFIAIICPDSTVLGVDECWEGINIAQQLADNLKLSNISFVQKDFRKIKKETFDTVFMSKVLHEIDDMDNTNWYQPREGIIESFTDKTKDSARRISNLINENGNLISIERIPSVIGIYGYYLALEKYGLYMDMNRYEYFSFTSIDSEEKMPFGVFTRAICEGRDFREYFNKILDEQERREA